MDKIKEHIEVMVDLETAGLKPGCAIAMIGATTFGSGLINRHLYFKDYASISDHRFDINQDTMAWWATKDAELRARVFNGTKRIDLVLHDFADYLEQFEDYRVWGNAASFDLKILERAYELCDMPVPWGYKQEMCYRTLKNLYPQVPYKKPRISHDALEDAIAQANHADEILGFKAALELEYNNAIQNVNQRPEVSEEEKSRLGLYDFSKEVPNA